MIRRALFSLVIVAGTPGCLMTDAPGQSITAASVAVSPVDAGAGSPGASAPGASLPTGSTPVSSTPSGSTPVGGTPTGNAPTPTPGDGLTAIPYRIGYTAAGSTAAADIAAVNGWLGRPIDITAATLTMTAWWYGGVPKNYVIDVSFPMLSISGWDSLKATDMAVAASGGYDKYYTAMARTLANAGNPMIVRIGWEMNGNWYPWSIGNAEGVNNTGANYIATFRRIAGILRANVPGVKIEFCTNWEYQPYAYANGTNAGTPLDYWPGAAYVDYVSMDIYESNIGNWKTTQSTGAYNLDWLVTFARQQHVRVGLPEWGAGKGDVGYITSAISWMNSLGPLFAFSVYSSWEPADQFLQPGQNLPQQKAFAAAYTKTKFVAAP